MRSNLIKKQSVKKRIISLCAIGIILISAVLIWSPWEKAPLADLKADEIISIEVYATPPNESIIVEDRAMIEEITSALNEVVVYKRVIDLGMSGGQGVRYTISFEFGDTMEVPQFGQQMGIDEQRYKGEYLNPARTLIAWQMRF